MISTKSVCSAGSPKSKKYGHGQLHCKIIYRIQRTTEDPAEGLIIASQNRVHMFWKAQQVSSRERGAAFIGHKVFDRYVQKLYEFTGSSTMIETL